jgi:hypothetical protein
MNTNDKIKYIDFLLKKYKKNQKYVQPSSYKNSILNDNDFTKYDFYFYSGITNYKSNIYQNNLKYKYNYELNNSGTTNYKSNIYQTYYDTYNNTSFTYDNTNYTTVSLQNDETISNVLQDSKITNQKQSTNNTSKKHMKFSERFKKLIKF